MTVANMAWCEFGSSKVGENYLRVCERASGEGAEDAANVVIGIRSILSGTAKNFMFEYSCHSPIEPRWFQMRVAPAENAHLAGAIVMHVDITERKIAEIALAETEQQ